MASAVQSCRHLYDAARISPSSSNWALKRRYDVVLGVVLWVATLPLLATAAVLIRLTSRGPVIFRQTRIGLDGREFSLLKLRTMFLDAERSSGPVWAAERDPRITPVGRILRKFRVDELPQLINVIAGEMSLVGPRPERPVFVERFQRSIPHYEQRTKVLPGITGLAQVRCGYGAGREDAVKKLEYDLDYVRNAGAALDTRILLTTVRVVLAGAGR